MMETRRNGLATIVEAAWAALSRGAAWLIERDEQEADPFLDPVFRQMSPRELADLPVAPWPAEATRPAEKETSPVRIPERLKKMPERTASPAPGLPKDGVDVQQAKRCASAP
ncbi:hypothetical protein [Rhizobium sp. FKL33]|uniref:hypothetical protein n=1 Tax=Rhizobium sp. FKL33 TaxID=2562307 RepID=UPI001484EBBB|nr:hypothetical protein [Rhizobium sp. FKL33]